MKVFLKTLIPNVLLNFYRKYLKTFHGNALLDKKMLKYINYENGFFFLDDNARLLADEIAADLFI